MSGSGIVKSGYFTPHVYFIFAHDVIYIGETQHIPVRRWSSHLDKSGSFTKKLNNYLDGGCMQPYLNSLSFFSISCFELLRDMQSEYCGYRIPTQALEHKLHEIVQSKGVFGSSIKVISETKKTAPRNFFHWNEIEDIAESCITRMLYLRKEDSAFVYQL